MFHLHWISTSSIPIHQGTTRDSFMKEHRNFWHLLSVENVPKRLKVAEKSGGGKGRKRKVRFLCVETNFPLIFISFYLSWNSELVWLDSTPVHHALSFLHSDFVQCFSLLFRSFVVHCPSSLERKRSAKAKVRFRRKPTERGKVHGSFLI